METAKVNRSCDFCRRRKKKCDNGHPCSNCQGIQNPCVYSAPKQRKKRSKKKPESQNNAIDTLNLRINNLESLLINLTTRLDKSLLSNSDSALVTRRVLKRKPNQVSSDSSDEGSSNERSSSASDYDRREPINELSFNRNPSSDNTNNTTTNFSAITSKFGSKFNNGFKTLSVSSTSSVSNSNPSTGSTNPTDTLSLTCPASQVSLVKPAPKFGHPSVFCMLSEKSLTWMKKRLRDNMKVITPLLNMPRALSNSMKTLSDIWVSNPPRITYNLVVDGPDFICSDAAVVTGLLESYYHTQNVDYFCSLEQIKPLFRRYFHNQNGSLPVHRFTSSQLLIMNIALALCACNRSFIDEAAKQAHPALAQTSSQSLNQLKLRCFQNAIVQFKNLQVQHEGIETVQALILLIIYIEYNFASDFDIFQMISSTLIKYAKDLKLHRASSLASFLVDEGIFRRILWSFCELVDTELCYRCGNPPLINMDDVTTLTEHDSHIFSVPTNPFVDNNGPLPAQVDQVVEACKRIDLGVAAYFVYFTLIYTRIRKSNYQLLYGHVNDNEDIIKKNGVLSSLEKVNEQMCKLSNLMDPSVRPTFHNDPKFDSSATVPDNCKLLTFRGATKQRVDQLSMVFKTLFFTHLSTLNKIAVLFYYNDNPSEKALRLGDLAMQSARTILHISLTIEFCPKESVSAFAGGICFYPLMSYLTIAGNILAYPHTEASHHDCLLLIQVSKLYAKCSYEDSQSRQQGITSPLSSTNSTSTPLDDSYAAMSKLTLMDLFTRILLRPVIALMAAETSHDYCKDIEGLNDFLNGSEDIFPDLFVQDNQEVSFVINKDNARPYTSRASLNYGSPLDFFNSPSPGNIGPAPGTSLGLAEGLADTQPTQFLGEMVGSTNPVMSDAQFFDVFGEDEFMKLLNSQFYTFPNFRLDTFETTAE